MKNYKSPRNLPESTIYHITYDISCPISHQSSIRQFNFRMRKAKIYIFRTLNLSSNIAKNMVSAYECLQVPTLFSKRCKLRCYMLFSSDFFLFFFCFLLCMCVCMSVCKQVYFTFI